MSALAEDTVDNKAGKKFRLVVRSAEEAVRVIREKLGEDARVLSVKQVGGEGLKRFISSPKLEVIAEVPGPESTPEEADACRPDSVPESSKSPSPRMRRFRVILPTQGSLRKRLMRTDLSPRRRLPGKRPASYPRPALMRPCFPRLSLGPTGRVSARCRSPTPLRKSP